MTAPKAKAVSTTSTTDPAATKNDEAEALELKPGYVVFFDAAVYGETDPVVHAGVVIATAGDRVRVKDLGPAVESADFTAAAVRLSA